MPCALLLSGTAGPWKAQFCSEAALHPSEQATGIPQCPGLGDRGHSLLSVLTLLSEGRLEIPPWQGHLTCPLAWSLVHRLAPTEPC